MRQVPGERGAGEGPELRGSGQGGRRRGGGGGRAGSAPAHRPAGGRRGPGGVRRDAGPCRVRPPPRSFPGGCLPGTWRRGSGPGERRGSRKSSSVDAETHQINYRLIGSDKYSRVIKVRSYEASDQSELRYLLLILFFLCCLNPMTRALLGTELLFYPFARIRIISSEWLNSRSCIDFPRDLCKDDFT